MGDALQVPHASRGSCRSCGADLIWAKSLKGRPMPLDAETVLAAGETLFTVDDRGTARRSLTDRGHRSHFATCPQADEWRKPR